jgi:hypothetical protein
MSEGSNMRLVVHGDKWVESFEFTSIPDGKYEIRTTVNRPGQEPYDFQWPVELKNGTLYFLECVIPETPIVKIPVTGEVKEHYYLCRKEKHAFSIMVKSTVEVGDFLLDGKNDKLLTCVVSGCYSIADPIGENPAEVSKNPVDLLNH